MGSLSLSLLAGGLLAGGLFSGGFLAGGFLSGSLLALVSLALEALALEAFAAGLLTSRLAGSALAAEALTLSCVSNLLGLASGALSLSLLLGRALALSLLQEGPLASGTLLGSPRARGLLESYALALGLLSGGGLASCALALLTVEGFLLAEEALAALPLEGSLLAGDPLALGLLSSRTCTLGGLATDALTSLALDVVREVGYGIRLGGPQRAAPERPPRWAAAKHDSNHDSRAAEAEVTALAALEDEAAREGLARVVGEHDLGAGALETPVCLYADDLSRCAGRDRDLTHGGFGTERGLAERVPALPAGRPAWRAGEALAATEEERASAGAWLAAQDRAVDAAGCPRNLKLAGGRLREELAAKGGLPEVAPLELKGQALNPDRAFASPETDLLEAAEAAVDSSASDPARVRVQLGDTDPAFVHPWTPGRGAWRRLRLGPRARLRPRLRAPRPRLGLSGGLGWIRFDHRLWIRGLRSWLVASRALGRFDLDRASDQERGEER